MNAAVLLADLDTAGITLTRNGAQLHYRTQPGVSIATHRARIRENKPALLAELRAREELAAMGLDPALQWVRVSTAPVEASQPPEGWDGGSRPGAASRVLVLFLVSARISTSKAAAGRSKKSSEPTWLEASSPLTDRKRDVKELNP